MEYHQHRLGCCTNDAKPCVIGNLAAVKAEKVILFQNFIKIRSKQTDRSAWRQINFQAIKRLTHNNLAAQP